jgi:hypothetical protein
MDTSIAADPSQSANGKMAKIPIAALLSVAAPAMARAARFVHAFTDAKIRFLCMPGIRAFTYCLPTKIHRVPPRAPKRGSYIGVTLVAGQEKRPGLVTRASME